MELALIIAGILALVLMTQRWFWLIVFGVGGLASFFSCLASIFHFQILGALGFFFLGALLWGIFVAIASRL